MPIRVPVEQTGLERSIQNAAKSAGRNLKINLGTSAKDIKSLEQPLGRITGQADEFTKSMEAANARVLAFGASVGIINSVVQSFKALVSTTVEVEKSLAKINSILQTSVSGLDSLKKQIFDIARGTEQTFDTVAEAALELSRQGLSATEVTKRLNDSLILSRLSGISAAEAVSGLTAAVNSFTKAGLTTGEVLNKISNAANQFAVSERDLIEGFKRSASVAELAGVSIDELGGIITAVQQKTARGGAVIGNSFKTIFTRIGRSENLELLRDLGIQVTDIQGKILPATKLIENLAKEIENLGDVEVREITQQIGGGFQIAPLLAALSDYSSQNSIAIRATEAFATASDQAYKKNEALNQTLAAAINRTTLSVKELANTLGELGVTDTFKTLLDFFNKLASGAEKVLDGEGLGGKFARGIVKGLGTSLIQGGLALFGVLILKLSGQLAKFGLESIKTFFNLNKEAKRVQATQQQIVSTLLSDKTIREQILKIESSSVSVEQKRAQQAEFFNTALQKQLATLNQINTISAGIASPIARATSGSRVRRGASGYLPVGAEQSDISKGVGGAPSSAKPVVIPNFAFGGGKKGTMVANSSEYIVPNFAGGGSAIFNQDMVKSMGLPSGAKKINAAGGYIPNFAANELNANSRYVMMTGEKGASEKKEVYRKKDGSYSYKDSTGAIKINVPIYRIAEKTKAKDINEFSDRLETYAYRTALVQAKSLSGGQMPSPVKKDAIKQNLNKGSVGSFAGTIYELSLAALLTDEEFLKYAAATDTANFDLSLKGQDKLKGLYGISGNPAFGEVKGRGNRDNILSTAAKIYRVESPTLIGEKRGEAQQSKLVKQQISKDDAIKLGLATDSWRRASYTIKKSDLGKIGAENFDKFKKRRNSNILEYNGARGYIPNFAMSPLEDAIQREKEAGVPINQIRINQDGRLRNSQNPQGLAVTNTRDEPTGAIPNFAQQRYPAGTKIDGKSVGGQFVTQEGLDKLNKSADSASKSIDKTSKSSTDAAGKLFGISAIAFGVQGALGGLADEASGLKKGFLEITQGITQGVTTLTALQSLGLSPGFGFGVKKGGAGRNLSASGLRQSRAGRREFAQGGVGNIGAFFGGGGRVLAGGARFGIGKVLATFGRFVPILGSVVVGFQVLNPILKKLGVDLGAIGGKLFKGLLEKLNIIDTPAEKSAKSLEDFADKVQKTLGQGGPVDIIGTRVKELQAQRRGVTTKGKSPEEIEAELRAKNIGQAVDIFGTNQKTGLRAVLGLGDLTTREKELVTGTRTVFAGPGSSPIPQKFESSQEVLRIAGEIIEDEELFKAIDRNLSAAQRVISSQLYNLIDPKLLKGIDANTTEGKQQIQKLLAEKSKELFGDEESKKALEAAFTKFTKDLQVPGLGVQGAEQRFLESIQRIPTFKSAVSNITPESVKQLEEAKRVQAEILQIERASNLERAKTLAAIKSQTQFALELRAASRETGAVEKENIDQQIRGLEAQKKLSEQLTDSFTKRVEDSDTIRRLASATGAGLINVADYEKVNKLLFETNQKIREGKDFEKDLSEEVKKQLISYGVRDRLAEKFVKGISAEQNALKASSVIDRARNELAQARLDILKAQATAEERAQKARDRALRSSRSTEDFEIEKKRLDLQAERIRLEAGTIGKGARGSLQNRRDIENLRVKEQRLANEEALKALFRSLQDELIRDVRSSGLSGKEKRALESQITSADTETKIVSVTQKAETAIINAENRLEENAKERERKALDILIREETAVNKFATSTDKLATAVDGLTGFLQNPLSSITGAIDSLFLKKSGEKPVSPQTPASTGAADSNVLTTAEKQSLAKVLDSTLPGLPAPVNVTPESLFKPNAAPKGRLAPVQFTELEQKIIDTRGKIAQVNETNAKRIANAQGEANNAVAQLGEAIKNFAQLAKDAVSSFRDTLEQAKFDAFTSADPSQIQSAITRIQGVNVGIGALGQGASNEDAERMAQEFILLETKRAEIRKATSTATRVDLEFELEKTIKILELRNKFREAIRSGASNEDLQKIKTQIEAEEKATQSIGDRLRKIGITGEEGIERLKDSFATGADQFISSLSSGMSDAIAKGESLGDVLRNAAYDFASQMAKASLDSLFRQGVGAILPGIKLPGLAEGGMITGGSGVKDDVPAVLMGGEYVMKKSAVQKYGPNFMNALNNGQIQGYNQGGMVRTESGTQSSSWTPRSDKTEERDGYRRPSGDVRTESGLLASYWTREASYLNSKKSELEKGLNYRSDSGIFVSRWTPQSVYESKEDFEKEYFPEEDQEVRAESGITISRWTKEASQPNRAKEPSKSGRTESGLEASRWTRGASNENPTRIEKSPFITGRVESGIPVSRWNTEAQPFQATNTESFGKTIAVDFLNEVKLNSSKVIPDTLSSAVPAMTMGGEFVINKKSVDKYGPAFLDKVNQGAVQKFANGGLVQGDIFGNRREDFEYKRQTGKGGDYFAPGLYDAGNITGAGDLLDFATQAFTSGKKDYISSPSAGAAVVALEPESVRLTNFGRSRDTPLQQATRDAKNQAFELNVGYQRDYFEYLKRREAEKKAAKAQRKAFLTNIGVSLLSAGLSAGISGAGNALKGAEAAAKASGTVLSGFDKFKIGAKGFFMGGSLPGQTQTYGGLANVFNERGATSLNMNQYVKENINTPFIQDYLDKRIELGNIPKAILETNIGSSYQGGRGTSSFRATGGYIPTGTGIDDVPAMLTGGEFVLNSAATQRIGQENLEVANAGGEQGLGGVASEELIEKIEELIDVTRENAGEINITVTGGSSGGSSGGSNNSRSGGSESTESSGAMEDNKARQELAKQIKEKVLEVIREEKRLGGTLRN